MLKIGTSALLYTSANEVYDCFFHMKSSDLYTVIKKTVLVGGQEYNHKEFSEF